MKKMSAQKQLERKLMKKKAKKERLILGFSAVPPFAFTIVLIILYAFKKTYLWLFGVTALTWFMLGGLFLYAMNKDWGYTAQAKNEQKKDSSVVTVYNIILIFTLAIFFTVLFIRKLF